MTTTTHHHEEAAMPTTTELTDADLAFVIGHAYDYAAQSPSWGRMAGAYAQWYVDRYAPGAVDLSDFPDHSRAWPEWLSGIEV